MRLRFGYFFRSLTAFLLLAVTASVPGVLAASQVTLSGTAVQGPMIASTVTAYAVDPASGADLRVLATTKTDASGDFTLRIAPRVGRCA